MQNKVIYVNFENSRLITAGGQTLTYFPSLSYYACPTWEIHLLDDYLNTVDVSEATAWQAAVDVDFNSSSEPMVRTLATGIDASQAASGIIKVELDARTQNFFEKVDGKNSVNAFFELRGRDSEAKVIYELRFRMNALGVIDPDGGEPLPVEEGGATMTEVLALLRSAVDYRFSADGTNWHDAQLSSDVYYQTAYPSGAWSETIMLPSGSTASITIDTSLSSTSTNPVENQAVYAALTGKLEAPTGGVSGQYLMYNGVSTEWADVQSGGGGDYDAEIAALTGDIQTLSTSIGNVEASLSTKQDLIALSAMLDYGLISGAPTVPTSTSQLTNDSSYCTSAYVDGKVKLIYQSSANSTINLNSGDYASLSIAGNSGTTTLNFTNFSEGDALALEVTKLSGSTVQYSSTTLLSSSDVGTYLLGVMKVNNTMKITAPAEMKVH